MNAKREKLFNYAKQKAAEDTTFWDKVKAAGRMLKAHKNGNYKIQNKTFFFVIGAIIYTIVPFDFDWVALVGWIDDFTILSFAFNQFNKEVGRFLNWENQHNTYPNVDIIDAEVIE